jgi:hypothetical protein
MSTTGEMSSAEHTPGSVKNTQANNIVDKALRGRTVFLVAYSFGGRKLMPIVPEDSLTT